MRTFLRADPDVIMVGEMRDSETAKIGIEASLTGHLVFSTLHTNSAPESIVRLLDLGMDPFNFADALLGVLGQRLARRLCDKCKQPVAATAESMRALTQEYCEVGNVEPEEVARRWRAEYRQPALYRPAGCPDCNHTGYRGRIGLHELLVATPAITRLIHARATVSEIQAAASVERMRTLKQDGIEKILQGHTDLHQVRAACG